MRILLDTHAFLWFVAGDTRVSAAVRSLIVDPANVKVLSIATPWEIAIKVSVGKLNLAGPFDVEIPREIARGGFRILPVTLPHLFVVATLPHHHRDPFDRLLIAQSLAEGMPILSGDAAFDPYGVARIW